MRADRTLHAVLTVVFLCISTEGLEPKKLSHNVYFTGFDGTRFEFPVFNKAIITLVTAAEYQINGVFIEHGTDHPLLTGVAFKYRNEVKLFAATLATAQSPNVSMSVLMDDKRFEPSLTAQRETVKLSAHCELVYDRRPNGDERVVLQLPEMVLYIIKYSDSPNLDLNIDLDGKVPKIHGVLGQTYAWLDSQSTKAFEGDETNYIASSMFADDAKCSLFEW